MQTIECMKKVIHKRWEELSSLNPEYLSDKGNAVKSAYRELDFSLAFYDSFDSILVDKLFERLLDVDAITESVRYRNHPEYIHIIKMVERFVINKVQY